MTWKTIDTAPKDGRSIILGWAPNGVIEYQAGTRWRNGTWTGGYIDATHWRPADFDTEASASTTGERA